MLSVEEIAQRAEKGLTNVDRLLESGSLEEKWELVRTYVKGAKVDPKVQEIELTMLPALFSWVCTGGDRWGEVTPFIMRRAWATTAQVV